MDRRQAVAALAVGSLFAAASSAAADDAPGSIRVPTEDGHRDLTGKQAEAYRVANGWLAERLKEAEAIRVGSTYADVVKHFRRDGGLASVTEPRFVMILCPYIKIDVVFETTEGEKARFPVPATARVVRVSRPYLQPEFLD
jgi:hypothetical protein